MVSVLLPARDAEKFLSESLDSILNQYLTDFEVIVVTQESKDSTKDIADWYSSIDSRIKHFEDKKTGVGSALNTAMSVARGAYLIRQDADDISLPNRLLGQVNFMNRYQNVDILGSGMKTIGREKLTWQMPQSHDDITVQFLMRSSLLHPTICIRGSFAKEKRISYSESQHIAEDFDLWVNLINQATFANLDFPTVQYRIHSSQVTQKHPDKIWESTSAIRRRLLESIVPNLSESDFKLHDQLTRNDSRIDFQDLCEWFEKILISNRSSCVLGEDALFRFLESEKNSFLGRVRTHREDSQPKSNLVAKLVRSVPVPIRQRIKEVLD